MVAHVRARSQKVALLVLPRTNIARCFTTTRRQFCAYPHTYTYLLDYYAIFRKPMAPSLIRWSFSEFPVAVLHEPPPSANCYCTLFPYRRYPVHLTCGTRLFFTLPRRVSHLILLTSLCTPSYIGVQKVRLPP